MAQDKNSTRAIASEGERETAIPLSNHSCNFSDQESGSLNPLQTLLLYNIFGKKMHILFMLSGYFKKFWKVISSNLCFYFNYMFWTLSFPWKLLSIVHSFWPQGLYSPWNSPDQNTGVGSLSLLQGIFPTQESNPGLLPCRWIPYQLSQKGRPNAKPQYKLNQYFLEKKKCKIFEVAYN